ncbi:MAG: alpha-amylase [Nitrospirae bacterium]|nr:alpha-amylase [Nitrospirota bacterium]
MLYEINAAAWLHELSVQYGASLSAGEVPVHEWDKIAYRGFHYVWFMGIWKRSQAGKTYFREAEEYRSLYNAVLPGWTEKDIIGSPYSIAAYEPDPLIGTWEDIDRVRAELRKRGIGLILDFVPNHTGPDHPWVMDHPDYYIQGTEDDFRRAPAAFFSIQNDNKVFYIARGRDPYFAPWPDTAQLNYFNTEMRAALISELKNIAGHCDGVRCDMAMLILNEIFSKTWEQIGHNWVHKPDRKEFWTEVRDELPETLLMAEAYWDKEWTLQQLGFDYTYDKRLYDRIVSFSAPDIYLHLKADISFQNKMTRFIENHDEPRSADIFGGDRLMTATILFSTLPGMKLYQQGQLEGKKIKLPVQLRRVKTEEPDEDVRCFYEKLLAITKQSVFHDGEWQLKEVFPFADESFQNLIAFTWKSSLQTILVVVNLGWNLSQGRIPLKDELAEEGNYLLIDGLNNQKYMRSGVDMATVGLHVILDGYKAHIFDLIPEQ